MSHTDPLTPKAAAGHHAHDHAEVDHEHTDVELRPLVGFAIGLLAVVAGVFVLMYGLLWGFQRQAAKNDPIVSPLASPAVEMPKATDDPFFGTAQGPRLITGEPAVLAKQRKMEAETLETYGWVGGDNSGVARIPIEEAKKLILQRGLPTRAEPAADPALGTRRSASGESSSGRAITGPVTAGAPGQEPAAPAPAQAPEHPPAAAPKGHGQ